VTDRAYNPDEIRAVGKKVSQLSPKIKQAGTGLDGLGGDSMFGELPSSGAISAALKKFVSGARKEFDAGAEQASSTGASLAKIAGRMDADEEEGARTFRGRQPE
jgi:hypothetical protein